MLLAKASAYDLNDVAKGGLQRRRSYRLEMTVCCTLGDCSRMFIVLDPSGSAYRLLLKALLVKLLFDGASAAGSVLPSCLFLTVLRTYAMVLMDDSLVQDCTVNGLWIDEPA